MSADLSPEQACAFAERIGEMLVRYRGVVMPWAEAERLGQAALDSTFGHACKRLECRNTGLFWRDKYGHACWCECHETGGSQAHASPLTPAPSSEDTAWIA